MNIGNNIKKICDNRGMTIAELSRRSGVKYSTLQDIINDNCNTSINNIIKITHSLGISIDDLVNSTFQEKN